MEDENKSGSMSTNLHIEGGELDGGSTFVSSVEGEPVLMVEGVSISATAFAAASNFGFGASLEGRTSNDSGIIVSGSSGMHISDAEPSVKREPSSDIRSKGVNGGPDTDVDIISSEKRTEPFLDGLTGNNEPCDDPMITANEKASTDSEASANEAEPIGNSEPSSDGRDTANEKANIDSRTIVNGRLLVESEFTPNESPSHKFEPHSNNGAPADAFPSIGHRLSGGTEATFGNTDVNGGKEASLEIGQTGARRYDNVQTTIESVIQDNRLGVTADDMSIQTIAKDDNRIYGRDGPVSVADNLSVNAATMNNDRLSSDANSIPVLKMGPSATADVVNGNLSGKAGLVSQEEASVDVLPSMQTAGSAGDELMVNVGVNNCVITNLTVDTADMATDKSDSNAGLIVKEKLSADSAFDIDIRLSANAGSTLDEKPADSVPAKDGESLAGAGLSIALVDSRHTVDGRPLTGLSPPYVIDANAAASARPNRNAAPFLNVSFSDNVNISAKAHGSNDTVPFTVLLDSTVNGTSADKPSSIELGSSTGAVTDEGLGPFAPQDEGQAHADHGEGEVLVGQKVRKRFGKKKYTGEVIGFDQETFWYKVTYEDGDEEDLEWEELEPILLQLNDEKIIRRRRRRARFRVGEPRRSFKRVRRPHGPKVSRGRGRTNFNTERHQSMESNEGKMEDKSKLDNEVGSIANSVDRLSTPMRMSKRRHSEELCGTPKRRKLETEVAPVQGQTTGSKIGNTLIMDAKPHGQSDLTGSKVLTRRNSASSASNLEAVSGSNENVENSIPEFHDSAKSESLESSDKKVPPQGGGVDLIGRKTRKDFGGRFYEGEVVGYDFKAKYYKVKYEDGDEEELEWSELEPTLLPLDRKPLSFKSMLRARNLASRQHNRTKVKDHSTSSKEHTPKAKQALVLYDVEAALNEHEKYASVLGEGREDLHAKEDCSGQTMMPLVSFGLMPLPPRPLAAARFASAGDADIYEYFGWGEVTHFDKAKCPELHAAKLLPTSSPIVHLAASQHHLAAITAAGQVWLWRNNHGNIHTRCNEWEHIASLEEKAVVLVDIAGPDLDRASSGYQAEQEDQVPDPFYLVAVSADGQDFVLQGSQPQEPVRTYQLSDKPEHLGLKGVLSQLDHSLPDGAGRIVQVSVGTVEAPDESPFIGYITDTDHVYIRSATRDYMEEINLITGYTGKPIKIQCGRVYHAIIMTDDGRAWTWGRGYYPGLNSLSTSGFPVATCQPAVGTLVGRKVIDVGCYGEDFIALTNDGDVHQWTHAFPNPAAGVYNVPAAPLYGHGPCILHGDKLKQVSIGAGMCAGITDGGRVHTWRTAMKGGLIGILVSEKEALTPLGHEESQKDTTIVSLGHRTATKVMCVAGSLIVVVKKKTRGRMGPRRKADKSTIETGTGGQS
eukprot:Gb_11614 [translate_table: standard]